MPKINIDKTILYDLYVDKRKTAYEIAEMLQVNRSTIVRNLKKYGIDINPKQRKYEHVKRIPFTLEQKDFLIGTLLGDGGVYPHGRKNKSYRFSVGHCEEQKDLLLWKKIMLGNFVNVIQKNIDKRNNSIMYAFNTVVHHEFKFYRDLFYEGNIKVIKENLINYFKSPLSLAVWIMDDGYLNKNVNLRFHTEGFTYKEHEILQNVLRINFDIRSKICKYNRNDKEYNYLSLNKENTIKTSNIVNPYIQECMKYKLHTDPQRLHAEPSKKMDDIV